MAILLRAKCDAHYKDYFNELYRVHGGIPEDHQAAINMRMLFIRQYILERAPNDFQTPTERDWAYIVRREFRYDVTIRAMVDGLAAGLFTSMIRQVMIRKFVIWPMAPVALATFLYRQRALFIFYNKKLFDMCNVGEQYELGFARNTVLRKCNQILDREDF